MSFGVEERGNGRGRISLVGGRAVQVNEMRWGDRVSGRSGKGK